MDTPVAERPVVAGRTSFRALLDTVDRPFVVLDVAARLPTAMLPLGILLYVADRSGSYATGGLAVAALSVGGGLGGALVGLASDRFGQRVVGLLATGVQALALAAFLVLGRDDVLPVTMALAALIGLTNPQAGAMARSRWAAAAHDRHDRRSFSATAMAWEGALDEVSFVLGPVLIGTVAGLAGPSVGLVLALVLAAVTQSGFVLHPTALPGRGRLLAGEHHRRAPLPLLRVTPLLVAMAAVGLVFGATQTGVAARMAAAGTDELTGPVYAAMGVGAAISGLLTTRLPLAFRLEARIACGGALVALGGLAGVVSDQPLLLAASCLLLGVALAPALVSSYGLAERAAPLGWGTTMMTLLATSNVVGVAAGAAVAGLVVDRVSPGAALAVDVAAGGLVLMAGLAALAASPATPTRSSAAAAEA